MGLLQVRGTPLQLNCSPPGLASLLFIYFSFSFCLFFSGLFILTKSCSIQGIYNLIPPEREHLTWASQESRLRASLFGVRRVPGSRGLAPRVFMEQAWPLLHTEQEELRVLGLTLSMLALVAGTAHRSLETGTSGLSTPSFAWL